MKKYILFIVLIISMGKFVQGQIIYVTSAGGGLKNGTNWSNAYDHTQLQRAINEAADSRIPEVWVAAGTYKAGDTITSYFNMKSGVAIYGGFTGSELSRDARNWVSNATILSGEHGDPNLKTDNSKYVIYNDSVNRSGILDGFTIRDGFNGIGQGGAGGGIFNRASSPRINNCVITKNTGSFGGGVFNSESSAPLLTNCIITYNSARRGGAICNSASSDTLVNCLITNNAASVNGGAMFNEGTSSAPTFINCTIAGNTAGTLGGAVCNEAATTSLFNSIIWDNESAIDGSQFYIESGTVTLDYSCYPNEKNSIASNPNSDALFTAANTIVLDPLFISSNGWDFLISGNSPCADAGLDSYNNQGFDLRGDGYGRKLNKVDATPGTIDMGAYEYKFGEDPAGGSNYSWVGTTNSNWNNADNWSPNTVPTSADAALIEAGAPFYPLINSQVDCYNLSIASGASLTIAPAGEMTVTEAIINKGTLTIQSDATGTGSLIAETATGAGTTTVQHQLPANAWTMISSPVSGQAISSFLTAPVNVTAIETDGTSRGMMDFNPLTNTWNPFFTNSTEGTMVQGKGYSVRLQGATDATVTFAGSLIAGPVSVVTELDKWNCVGNPYTSAIGITSSASSADNFLARNSSNTDPAYGVYIWDRSNGGNQITGSYTAISNVPSPTTPGFEVQQGQAFMVKMKPKVAGISFNKSMQVHDPGLALKSAQADWAIIKLAATVNNQKSSTVIGFNQEMTNGLDPTYDAGLFKGPSELSLYSYLLTGDTIPFAIQALPDNQYEYMIIPLGLDSKLGGEVVFSAEVFNLPAPGRAILEDLQTHTFTDLATDVYSTTVEPNTKVSNRFRLHASHLTVNAVNNKEHKSQLMAYPKGNTEIRVTGSVGKSAIATLYDIQGKVVLMKLLEEGSINSIPTPNLQPGIYLLTIKDNQQVQSFKIPVTR